MRGSCSYLSCIIAFLCSVSCSNAHLSDLQKRSFPPDADYQPLLIPKEEGPSSPEELQQIHTRPRSFRYLGGPSARRNGRGRPSLRMSAANTDWPPSEDEAEASYRPSEGPSLATVYAQQEEEDTAQSKLATIKVDSDEADQSEDELEEDEMREEANSDYEAKAGEEEANFEDDQHYVQDWSYYDDTESMSAQHFAEPFHTTQQGDVDPTTRMLLRLSQKGPRVRRKGAWHADLPECYKDILQTFCQKIVTKKQLIPNRQNVPREFRRLSEETIDKVIEAFTTQFGWDLDHALDEIINEIMESGRAGDGRGYDIKWASMHTPTEVKRLRAIARASGRKRPDNYLRSITYRRRMKALVKGTEEYRKLRTCRPWHRASGADQGEGYSSQ